VCSMEMRSESPFSLSKNLTRYAIPCLKRTLPPRRSLRFLILSHNSRPWHNSCCRIWRLLPSNGRHVDRLSSTRKFHGDLVVL
jgi:hypothetical protein